MRHPVGIESDGLSVDFLNCAVELHWWLSREDGDVLLGNDDFVAGDGGFDFWCLSEDLGGKLLVEGLTLTESRGTCLGQVKCYKSEE